jgi:hypothetical protein
MRTIKIYSTVGTAGTIITNVETLRELKPLLEDKGINYNEMKLLVGETKNELSVDESILPSGDFKLYLMPQKTKSGGFEDTLDEVQNTVDDIEHTVDRIEDKVDEILSILRSGGNISNISADKPSPTPSLSYEDELSLRELRKMSGASSENSWS